MEQGTHPTPSPHPSSCQTIISVSAKTICCLRMFQDLYCVRSDLGNLLKALGRLDEAKVWLQGAKCYGSYCVLACQCSLVTAFSHLPFSVHFVALVGISFQPMVQHVSILTHSRLECQLSCVFASFVCPPRLLFISLHYFVFVYPLDQNYAHCIIINLHSETWSMVICTIAWSQFYKVAFQLLSDLV